MRCLSRLGPRIRTLTLDIARVFRPCFPLVSRTWIFARAEINRANLPASDADGTRAALFGRSEKRDGVRLVDVEPGGDRSCVLVFFFPRGDNPYCGIARSPLSDEWKSGLQQKNNRHATGFDEVAVVMAASTRTSQAHDIDDERSGITSRNLTNLPFGVLSVEISFFRQNPRVSKDVFIVYHVNSPVWRHAWLCRHSLVVEFHFNDRTMKSSRSVIGERKM